MMNLNDIIAAKLTNQYRGSERKETVVIDYQGEKNKYLLKLPDPVREQRHELSYINNAISEYLGCKIISSMGMETQDVLLGEYTNDAGKTYIACACKDIVPPGYSLAEAATTSLGSENSSHAAAQTTFDAINVIADEVKGIDREELLQWYYNLFIADSFIGNTDRHNQNGGILTSIDDTRIAPVYDCGSSLSPLLTDEEMTEEQAIKDAKNVTSVLSVNNKSRARYYDILINSAEAGLDGKEYEKQIFAALRRMLPKIDMENIINLVENTEYISRQRKDYYIALLDTRYEQVLLPTLERGLNRIHPMPTIIISDPYEFYKSCLQKYADLPLYGKTSIKIHEEVKNIRKVSSKYVMMVDNRTGAAECMVPVRSSNRDVKKAAMMLCGTYSLSLDQLKELLCDSPRAERENIKEEE